MVWAAEPHSAWYTDDAGNEVIEDGFFYQPLGGALSNIVAGIMIIVGVGMRGFAVSRQYRWIGGPLAIVLTWCLGAALAIAISALFQGLRLNPDVWGWWVTLSDMFYEGAVALGVVQALTALAASFAAVQLVRVGADALNHLRNRADRASASP